MYSEVFWRSIKRLKLAIFLPDLYLTFIELILGFFFLKFSGVITLLSNPEFIAASIEQKIPILGIFVSENLLNLLTYLIIFGLTSFILGSSLNSIRYGMIRDLVSGEKVQLRKSLSYGIRFWPIVLVRLVIFAVGIITFLFLLGCYAIIGSYFSNNATLFIMMLLAVAGILLLKLLLLFTYAIMFLGRKGAFSSVKNSFSYFLKNKGYVFKVFIVIFGCSLALLPFEIIFTHYQNVMGIFSFYAIIALIVRSITSVIYNVWSEVLIFYSYQTKEPAP